MPAGIVHIDIDHPIADERPGEGEGQEIVFLILDLFAPRRLGRRCEQLRQRFGGFVRMAVAQLGDEQCFSGAERRERFGFRRGGLEAGHVCAAFDEVAHKVIAAFSVISLATTDNYTGFEGETP